METRQKSAFHWRVFLLFVLSSILYISFSSAQTLMQDTSNSAYKPTRQSTKTQGNISKTSTKKSERSKPLAQIVSVRQKVDVKKAGDEVWKKAEKKSDLKSSDKVRTGRKSVARVKLQDGSTILLLQNSEAEMENLSTVQKTIKLLKGKVRAIVKSLKNPGDFQVKTPIGVASVRGTDFTVEFDETSNQMAVDVLQGEVGVSKLGELAKEVIIQPGEKLQFGAEGEIGSPMRSGALPMGINEVHAEIQNDQAKFSILSQVAEEERIADYQTGKSLIDVDGKRVRVEQYIMRPASNQFKLVSLNQRDNRFDYFTYKGTFNKDLPSDLSIALKEVGGQIGSDAPDYYLTGYDTLMSNTKDNITDNATGGHLVKISFDGTKYTLTDPTDPTNTRTINQSILQSDGSYEIYDPVHDQYSAVTAGQLSAATNFSILDGQSGAYRNYSSGDTLWKTRYNNYSYLINSTIKTSWAKNSSVTNVLNVDNDATFTNRPIVTISETPSGTDLLNNRLSLFYQDGSETVYDNYIIDDQGKIGGTDSFNGISTSADYKNELQKWNYQQKITSTEMKDEINLVIDPRIGTMSGLIQ